MKEENEFIDEEVEKISQFCKEHSDFITALRGLRQQSATFGFKVEDVALFPFWEQKYPNILEKLGEATGGNRLLGFNFKIKL